MSFLHGKNIRPVSVEERRGFFKTLVGSNGIPSADLQPLNSLKTPTGEMSRPTIGRRGFIGKLSAAVTTAALSLSNGACALFRSKNPSEEEM